jgi:hypothetical protein
MKIPSLHQIGEIVSFNVGDENMPVAQAKITAITFTDHGKVLYDLALLLVDAGEATYFPQMQRVDSCRVGDAM